MINVEVRNRFRHDCDLRHSQTSVDYGRATKWKTLRNLLLVEESLQSGAFYRSHAEYAKARKLHLTDPGMRYVIHPFSTFHSTEVLFVQVLWFLTTFLDNFLGSFYAREFFMNRDGYKFTLFTAILYVANMGFLFDVFVRTCSGIPIDVTRTVLLDHKTLLKIYFKGYFWADFLPILGFFVFYYWNGAKPIVLFCFFQLHKCRLFRGKIVLNQMSKVLEQFKAPEALRRLIELSVLGFLILHLLTCVSGMYIVILKMYKIPLKNTWYASIIEEQRRVAMNKGLDTTTWKQLRQYSTHFNVVACHFFGVHTFKFKSHDPIEMVFLSFVLALGLSFYVYCVAKIMEFVSVNKISEDKFEDLTINAEFYGYRKDFTPQLKSRIDHYYQYKFNKKYFDEDTILSSLSEHLQMEVLLYSCRNLINQVPVFKGLSKAAVGCLLSLLKRDIFVPRDEILRPDDDTESIYFILFGTCGIEVGTGREMMHIQDGEHFGNLVGEDLSEENPKLAYTVVALEMVEVYRLNKDAIKYCQKIYPEIQTKLEVMEKMRFRRYFRIFSTREEVEDLTEDIVNALRKGKILRDGIRREELMK